MLDNNNHLALLDEMFNDKLESFKDKLSFALETLASINNSIKDLGGLDKDRENNIRLIQFEIDEINSANLVDGEEDQLKERIIK